MAYQDETKQAQQGSDGQQVYVLPSPLYAINLPGQSTDNHHRPAQVPKDKSKKDKKWDNQPGKLIASIILLLHH